MARWPVYAFAALCAFGVAALAPARARDLDLPIHVHESSGTLPEDVIHNLPPWVAIPTEYASIDQAGAQDQADIVGNTVSLQLLEDQAQRFESAAERHADRMEELGAGAQYSKGCLDASTLVATTEGPRTIERLYDEAFAPAGRLARNPRFVPLGAHGPVRALAVTRTPFEGELVVVELGAGGSARLALTPDHRVERASGGVLRAAELREGELLWTAGGAGRVQGVARRAWKGPVYNLVVEGDASFVANGVGVKGLEVRAGAP